MEVKRVDCWLSGRGGRWEARAELCTLQAVPGFWNGRLHVQCSRAEAAALDQKDVVIELPDGRSGSAKVLAVDPDGMAFLLYVKGLTPLNKAA